MSINVQPFILRASRLTARCTYHCASNYYTRYYLIVTYKRPYNFLLLCCTIFITWQNKPDKHPASQRIHLPTFSCFTLVERKVKVAPVQAIKLYEGDGGWGVGRGGKYHPILKLGIKCRLVLDSFHNHDTYYWLLNRLTVVQRNLRTLGFNCSQISRSVT